MKNSMEEWARHKVGAQVAKGIVPTTEPRALEPETGRE